ncbi:hypothetical protein F5B20DRAFT_590602 [Whalleya microplaca]|nr:hypothetical protein F5B20DRAFT_590602 [Whalleya microplaca]
MSLQMIYHLLGHHPEPRSDCPPSEPFYSCRSNGFTGCCQVDPCNRPGCVLDETTSDATTDLPSDVTIWPPSTDSLTISHFLTHTPSFTSTITETVPGGTDTDTETITVDVPTTHSTPTTTATDAETTTATTDSASTTSDTTSGNPTSSDPTPDTAATTQTLGPLPTPTNPSQSDDGKNVLPTAAIAGISVGAIVVAVIVLLVVYLLIRRRRIAKQMSSSLEASPRRQEEKSVVDLMPTSPQPPKNGGGAGDVFAPFGGRSNSCGTKPPSYQPQEAREDDVQPSNRNLSSADTYEVSPMSPEMNLPDTPQLDSRPVYVELDSGGDGLRHGRESSTPSDLVSPLSTAHSSHGGRESLSHPIPLTPGYPGTQMSIQSQLASTNTDNAHATHKRGSSQSLASSAGNFPRATLRATRTERQNNQHVMSWSQL